MGRPLRGAATSGTAEDREAVAGAAHLVHLLEGTHGGGQVKSAGGRPTRRCSRIRRRVAPASGASRGTPTTFASEGPDEGDRDCGEHGSAGSAGARESRLRDQRGDGRRRRSAATTSR